MFSPAYPNHSEPLNDENKVPFKDENGLSQNNSQTDSQSSNGLSQAMNLANYVVNQFSSQDCFGSQKLDLTSLSSTQKSSNPDEMPLFETPAASQEDLNETLQHDIYDSDTEIDESDETPQIRPTYKANESNSFGCFQTNFKQNSVAKQKTDQPNYPFNGPYELNNKVNKLDKFINKKQPIQLGSAPYVDYRSSSIGKSDKMIGKLVGYNESDYPNGLFTGVESIGKSHLNYGDQSEQFNVQINYNTTVFVKNDSFTYANGKVQNGKVQNGFVNQYKTNQYPASCYVGGKKQIYDDLISTDLNQNYRVCSDLNSSNLNLSASSSPINLATSFDDSFVNDDSNDSAVRKRKKQLANESSDRLIKVTKTLNDEMKKDAEIKSQQEVKSLSQQLEDTSINKVSSNYSSFTQRVDYYDGSVSTSRSQIDSHSFTSLNKKNGINEFVNKRSLNKSDLVDLEMSIETPLKAFTSQTYGPIPKSVVSSCKKSKQGRKSKSTAQDNLIKKAPMQRRLNISESEPVNRTKQSSNKMPIANELPNRTPAQKKSQKNQLKTNSNEKSLTSTSRSARERTSSISSRKSTASVLTDEESFIDSTEFSKKERRKINNRESAKQYRMREKEKEKELDKNLDNSKTSYIKLRRELRNILVKKHAFISSMLATSGTFSLPDWTKDPKARFLI